MAMWKEPVAPKDAQPARPMADTVPASPSAFAETPQPPVTPYAAPAPALKESVIAGDLSIEGKIEGTGHVRIAGRFKGDVNVKGDLTIEQGAKLEGGVRAQKVILSGELDGNIAAAQRVELMASCAMNGDIKCDTLTVAAGSRLRGHVECGAWSGSGTANTTATTDHDRNAREAEATSA